ncbi:MAG: hypothetical protein PHH23_01615 [Paludibacteraceae bacterium]|nr:hypothetical protein [Paludibacteraceae bacterium]
MTYISPKFLSGKNQEYYNSMDLDDDLIGLYLTLGRRKPQNDYERELLAEIQKMKAEGVGIEFPFN